MLIAEFENGVESHEHAITDYSFGVLNHTIIAVKSDGKCAPHKKKAKTAALHTDPGYGCALYQYNKQ